MRKIAQRNRTELKEELEESRRNMRKIAHRNRTELKEELEES
jgi:DNA-binding CsgD family transcriptional regulator